jgi:hypothetical protein
LIELITAVSRLDSDVIALDVSKFAQLSMSRVLASWVGWIPSKRLIRNPIESTQLVFVAGQRLSLFGLSMTHA